MIGVSLLGATGSIGCNTLDVISQHPDRYRVIALTAHTNTAKLRHQCERYRPQLAVLADSTCAQQLAQQLKKTAPEVTVLAGAEGLHAAATHPAADQVMAAIVGAAGLAPTLAAVKAGKRILLANKEALVMAGDLFMQAVRRHRATVLPIDSEHNAIYQCLPRPITDGLAPLGIDRITLTASGGPFLHRPAETFATITPAEACAHPKWQMGQKISVDSASLMNKGLEVIEAHYLFQASADQIAVVIHPQSIVHSLVTYADGSVLAQLSNPDMRTPIAHALAWPERHKAGVAPLDLPTLAHLDFSTPDHARFPCLSLAYAAIAASGNAPAVLNAANEVAVSHFLQHQLPFSAIPHIVETCLTKLAGPAADNLDDLLETDRHTRHYAMQQIV
ncbi:MAG: 1-deoxy-D-xylulose-5-phosphate reductoisomerase [Pseudomonadota bacterium]